VCACVCPIWERRAVCGGDGGGGDDVVVGRGRGLYVRALLVNHIQPKLLLSSIRLGWCY
jgi:hypothetical protein